MVRGGGLEPCGVGKDRIAAGRLSNPVSSRERVVQSAKQLNISYLHTGTMRMLINQDVAPVKGCSHKGAQPPTPKFIMFHGVEAPENRLIFEPEAGGRGGGYILDALADDFIPVRRGDVVVLVLVPGAHKTWRGWA